MLENEVFVFGSNLLGVHKRGAALDALKNYGAILGQGIGMQGHSYAIPTKRTPYVSLELFEINKFVADFIVFAQFSPHFTFNVTKIGCGLAGFTPEQIAPMFLYAKNTPQIILPQEFLDLLR